MSAVLSECGQYRYHDEALAWLQRTWPRAQGETSFELGFNAYRGDTFDALDAEWRRVIAERVAGSHDARVAELEGER